jgi:hypothetical protein
MSNHVKPAILRIFSKRHGLQVSKEGSQFLEEMVAELSLDASKEGLLDSLDFIAKAYIQHQRASIFRAFWNIL